MTCPAAGRRVIAPQNGIALVIVLWTLALLTIMAADYSQTMRTETLLTANLLRSAQAEALAEAGIWYTLAEMLKPDSEQTWKTDGTVYTRVFDPGIIRISIQDEAGKIDLNTAGSELLYGLLRSVNVAETERLSLLQAILDWRDRDNLVRKEGAEDADYLARNYDYSSKDGPFNTLDELQLVMGMTPSIFNKIKPALTIYSHHPGIQPKVAPREALLALPGITPERVEEILQERDNDISPQGTVDIMGLDPKYVSKAKGYVFTITSTGIINDVHARMDAVVMIHRQTTLKSPYSILSWRQDQGNDQQVPETPSG